MEAGAAEKFVSVLICTTMKLVPAPLPPLSLSLSLGPLLSPSPITPSSTSTEEVGLAACYSALVYVNVHVCGVWHLKEVRYCIRTQWMQVLI